MSKDYFRIAVVFMEAFVTWASGIFAPKNTATKWAKGPFFSRKQFRQVSFEEINFVIKNYNCPDKLASSNLVNLNLISRRSKNRVEALRNFIFTIIESYKPKEDIYRRVKPNLKYHLLKMIAYDESEEGQILWELGFEEYPMRIITNEKSLRKSLFKIKSPSDYTSVSRNAYIALKKELISEIAWKVNYLERAYANKKIRQKLELAPTKQAQTIGDYLP